MRLFFFILLIELIVGFILPAKAQQEPLAGELKSAIQHEAFTVNALVQAGLRYSLNKDDFQGGRTFEVPNARLDFKGILDNRFYYRIFFNMAKEPNILDALAGYRHSEALKITVGMMKPRQTRDYIPDPGSTDFIDRTVITGLLVQSREIGIAFDGNMGAVNYYGGMYNGNNKLTNNNNKFYYIGRLQYSFENLFPGILKLAVQGSTGDSPGVQSGNAGPVLRGKRAIYGTDFKWETNRLLLAAEYLAGELETQILPNEKETISGYYVTGGFRFLKQTKALVRWQSWGYKKQDVLENQFTFGINHNFTSLTSFQFNFDAYLPEQSDKKYGLSCIWQIQF